MLRANTKFFCSDRDDPEIFGSWYLEIGHRPPYNILIIYLISINPPPQT